MGPREGAGHGGDAAAKEKRKVHGRGSATSCRSETWNGQETNPAPKSRLALEIRRAHL